MKITFITTLKAYWGGCEELWTRCAQLAIKKGHQVQVVVYNQKTNLHPTLVGLKSSANSFIFLENDLTVNSFGYKILYKVKKIIIRSKLETITNFSPDCIVVSQAYNYDAAFYPEIYS